MSFYDLNEFCSKINSLSLIIESFDDISVQTQSGQYTLKYNFEKEKFFYYNNWHDECEWNWQDENEKKGLKRKKKNLKLMESSHNLMINVFEQNDDASKS